MIALLRWCLSVVIMVGVILFTFANRERIPVQLHPFHEPYDVFSFVLALGALAIGFVFGGVMVWLNSAEIRADRRKQKKRIKELEKELGKAREKESAIDTATLIESMNNE